MAAECKGLGGFGFKHAAALLHYIGNYKTCTSKTHKKGKKPPSGKKEKILTRAC